MKSKFHASAAAGAILVLMLGAAARADVPADDAGYPALDTQRVVTDDNGVQAAPTTPVTIDVITAAVSSRAKTFRSARARRAAAAAHVAAAAAKPRTLRLVSVRRLSAELPQSPILDAPVYEEDAPDVTEVAKIDPRPFELAQAERAPGPSFTPVARIDPRPVELADADPVVDEDEPVADEGPEEAAVYGRRVRVPDSELGRVRAGDARAQIEDPLPKDEGPHQHVAFPRRSAEAAAAFDGYMRSTAAIDAGLKSSAGVVAALHTGAAYDPRQFEEGMVAYGAMAALQSPRFVYGVMDAAADPRTRRALIDALLDEPWTATRLPGAEEAAGVASAAILEEASPVLSTGAALKQASYDVQRQAWSIAKASDQSGRLAHAKAVSSHPASTTDREMARLMTHISAGPGQSNPVSRRGVSQTASHSLALAALSILDGAAGEDSRMEGVLHDKSSADCLRLAKLNLFQCLSVVGPEYENVYCLAQHAVLDTGQCVAGAASASGPIAMAERGPRMSRIRD